MNELNYRGIVAWNSAIGGYQAHYEGFCTTPRHTNSKEYANNCLKKLKEIVDTTKEKEHENISAFCVAVTSKILEKEL